MFIKDIENKHRLLITMVIVMAVAMTVTCVGSVFYANMTILGERNSIYVLDANRNVFSAAKSNSGLTLEMEVKGHLEDFHNLFYTLGPDNSFIMRNVERANYLCDQSAYRHYMNQREKGFYTELVQNNVHSWIMTDSIRFDSNTMKFRYYGTIRYDRRTGGAYYKLETSGYIQVQTRSDNNMHGLMIRNWVIEKHEKQ